MQKRWCLGGLVFFLSAFYMLSFTAAPRSSAGAGRRPDTETGDRCCHHTKRKALTWDAMDGLRYKQSTWRACSMSPLLFHLGCMHACFSSAVFPSRFNPRSFLPSPQPLPVISETALASCWPHTAAALNDIPGNCSSSAPAVELFHCLPDLC